MPKRIQESGAFNTGDGSFYKPPEFFDSGFYKSGDIDKWHGQSKMVAQGGYKRLKKMKQGVLLVRFEMPYDVWCGGCKALIDMGTRFNDCEKKRVGKYFTTPLFEFSMKHRCGCVIRIQNDPKNITYKVTEGGKERVTSFSKESRDEHDPNYRTAEERHALRTDAVAMAANKKSDEKKGQSDSVAMALLQIDRSHRFSNPTETNKILLKRHKQVHGLYVNNVTQKKADLAKYGMEMLPVTEEEAKRAENVNFRLKSEAGGTILDRVQRVKNGGKNEAKPLLLKNNPKPKEGPTYQVRFHAGEADGEEDEEEEEEEEEEPVPPPPTTYNIPHTATPHKLSTLLSVILGHAIPQSYMFVSPPYSLDATLGDLAAKLPAPTTEGTIHLTYTKEKKKKKKKKEQEEKEEKNPRKKRKKAKKPNALGLDY